MNREIYKFPPDKLHSKKLFVFDDFGGCHSRFGVLSILHSHCCGALETAVTNYFEYKNMGYRPSILQAAANVSRKLKFFGKMVSVYYKT